MIGGFLAGSILSSTTYVLYECYAYYLKYRIFHHWISTLTPPITYGRGWRLYISHMLNSVRFDFPINWLKKKNTSDCATDVFPSFMSNLLLDEESVAQLHCFLKYTRYFLIYKARFDLSKEIRK